MIKREARASSPLSPSGSRPGWPTVLNAVTRLGVTRSPFPQPPLLGENIPSACDSSESCNNLLEKSHFTSRIASDFLNREESVTQATSKKHPLDRWLLNLIWDASADRTEPPAGQRREPNLFLPPASKGMAFRTLTTLSHILQLIKTMKAEKVSCFMHPKGHCIK